MERIILHCDLNCFFASVELLRYPALRDVPVAVCGDPKSRHGVILAKNEPAKKLGVQTAETIWQAQQKAPGLVLLPPHHSLYREYSKKINAIYGQYTDLVEPFGIDESWLDITGSMHLFGGDGKTVADALRERIRAELGLTISVGVSFNKIFAKLGSDYKKPDATTVIAPDNWRDIVWPLPVGDLLFVGKAAQKILSQYGITTIGQLAACKVEMLETLMGKMGRQLHEYANGLDHAPVRPQHEQEMVKSVGNGTTFPQNLTRWSEIRGGLSLLCDSVASRLRRHGLYCGGVSVTIRDAQFKTVSRQKRLGGSTHLMRDILEAALELTAQVWKAPTPIRMLTVTALYITPEAESYEQLDLLSGNAPQRSEKQEKLEGAMDAIREKYGPGAISFGPGGKHHIGWED
ncbi:MAG: DNA polymerase IV [Clostridiales bacterium]|nr:DNA polymerase IV [Candidatus Cacconaster stercorequi]